MLSEKARGAITQRWPRSLSQRKYAHALAPRLKSWFWPLLLHSPSPKLSRARKKLRPGPPKVHQGASLPLSAHPKHTLKNARIDRLGVPNPIGCAPSTGSQGNDIPFCFRIQHATASSSKKQLGCWILDPAALGKYAMHHAFHPRPCVSKGHILDRVKHRLRIQPNCLVACFEAI